MDSGARSPAMILAALLAPDPLTGSHAAGNARVKGIPVLEPAVLLYDGYHGFSPEGRDAWGCGLLGSEDETVTAHKHLKQLVRTRMSKTGESYATARRQIIGHDDTPSPDPATRAHFPGNVAATTALRVLLTHAGVRDPATGRPFTEAMLFGIAGGIGIGVFAFRYEKEDFSSFFVAGRHKWADDLDYLTAAARRFGFEPVVSESTSASKAEKELLSTLEAGPCVAWVDHTLLPHRPATAGMSGGGYHVVTVYRADPAKGVAWIGDLTDDPIAIPLSVLAEARGRIKKQKNRLLSIAAGGPPADTRTLIQRGMESGVRELLDPSMKAARRNFQLEAIWVWAERMEGTAGADSWERVFRPGRHLWRGLSSMYDFIEHYGTGGGLCRPLFADFLAEAAMHCPGLGALQQRYAELGRSWSELAEASLPSDVPLLAEGKRLLAEKAELLTSGADPAEIRRVWSRLEELEAQAADEFPLSDAECRELRAGLKQRLHSIAAEEEVAFNQLRELAGG